MKAVIWLSLTAMTLGQAAPPKPLSETEFIILVQSRQKQVDDLRDLDETEKAKVKELYQQALVEMAAVRRWAAKAAEFEKQAREAPAELEQVTAALATPLPSPSITVIPNDTEQIELMISSRQTELDGWRKDLISNETELKERAGRRAKIPEKINAAKKRLADLIAQLQTPLSSNEILPANSARRMILMAQRQSAEQEILCCEKEILAYEARTELLPKSRDLNVRRIALAEQEVKQWQEIVNERRQQEAEQQARQASREAGQAHPNVRRLIEHNAKLAGMRKSLAVHIVDTTAQLETVARKLTDLKERFKPVREKVEVAEKTNATSTMGLLLQKEREALPNLRAYRRNVIERQKMMGEVELARLDLLNERRSLANLDMQTQVVLQKLQETGQSFDRVQLEKAVREALQTSRDYLDALLRDHDTYFKKLADLTFAEKQLIEETEICARYIDERVLWIGSASPLGAADVAYARDALWWLAGPSAWLEIGRSLAIDARCNPAVSALALGFFALLFYWRRRFRVRVCEIGEKASRGSCCRFVPTLETAMLTVLIALAWPGLMYYLGWRLTAVGDSSDLHWVMGVGLTETARVFLALELLWNISTRCGLGESHFGWSAAATRLLRQNIRWFSLPIIPLMCVAVAMAWQQENDRWDAALGRICFIAALLCFSWVLHRILRPSSVVFQAMIAARRGGWFDRMRYFWYPLCMLTPAALAVLASVGYHYTARQLTTRLILTTYIVVGGVVCRALLLRWTLVNQRKLAIEQARQRRAAAAAQNEGNGGEEALGSTDIPTPAEPERDLAAINSQTRRIVEYTLAVACALAVWCAWIDVLPALSNINAKLWTKIVVETREVALPDGAVQLKTEEILRHVMLSDLCLAAIILATTIIAAKNIPGLLEMALLQHLPLDAGARYAVATVCRYVISIVGLLLCCVVLGVCWSKVQWLVAAMSLGLGFGLQEIFANFVSGLIILFERPVRVGDIVTIDNTSGVVSRIRMRATTITDWDRKELVIPNKEFITGRVLNWTLSDPVNRVVVNVGVAYGSDTQKATEILRKIAQNHPNVLADPPPWVMLESFGDNALNFVLRCFLPNLENRGAVIHELHIAIDREFRAAGIEIAFPQQDIHVRSIALPLPLLQPAAAGGNASWPPAARMNPTERAA